MDKKTFLTSLFDSFNKSQIDYFVYGEYESLPADTGGSDIDMIVAGADMQRAVSTAIAMGKQNGVALVSYYKSRTTTFARFLCEEGWGVQIDFFGKKHVHKGAGYYPVEYLRDAIKLHNGIKVLDIKTGYYVDYLKESVHILRAKEKYAKGFLEEYTKKEKRRTELYTLYGDEMKNLIDSNLSVEGLLKIAPKVGMIIRKKIHKHDLLYRALLRVESFRRIFRRPGYRVAVVGSDKKKVNDLMNNIAPILNEGFHHGVICNSKSIQVLNSVSGGVKMWLKIHTKSVVLLDAESFYNRYIRKSHRPKWMLHIGEWLRPTPDIILCVKTKDDKRLEQFCRSHKRAVWIDAKDYTKEEYTKNTIAVLYDMMKRRFNSIE